MKRRSFFDRFVQVSAYVFLALLGLLIASACVELNLYATRGMGGGGEFLLPWKAARGFLFEKIEPYGGAVASYVQEQVYGRPAAPGEKLYVLSLPFHLLMLYFPVGILGDSVLARGIDLFLSEMGLLALTFLSLRLTGWQPRRFFLIAFFLFAGWNFYTLRALFEASPICLLGLLYAGILLSLRAGLDELAGVFMALSFYQWETGGLFLFLILLRVFYQRRWQVLAGFFMLNVVLLLISFFIYPGWLLPFARGVLANWVTPHGFSTGEVLSRLWPASGGWLAWALTALLVIILIVEWSAARGAEFPRFYWVACLTLSATPLLGFRSEIESLAVLILPLAVIFAFVRARWKAGYWVSSTLLALSFAAPWFLFFDSALSLQLRQDVIFLFLPIFTVVGLYWVRWWAIRPPLTWLERATHPEYQ